MINILTVMMISSTLIVISWLFVMYSFIRKRNLSNSYGFIAITYILHAFVLQVAHLPNLFYIGFSILWLLFHSVTKNISNKNDISKKEDNLL